MVSVVLIVFPTIIAAVFLVIDLYIVAYFQHPLDKNTAYIPKFIVVRQKSFPKSKFGLNLFF